MAAVVSAAAGDRSAIVYRDRWTTTALFALILVMITKGSVTQSPVQVSRNGKRRGEFLFFFVFVFRCVSELLASETC